MTPDPPISLWPDPAALGPVTDLYQLTMMAGYAAAGIDQSHATFELFVRKLPGNRSYLIFAGLEQAIGTLLDLSFSREQVEGIRRWPCFEGIDSRWFDSLIDFKFTGDVWSIPEGSVVFAGEPLLRVSAPLAQAQLVETILLSSLGYPTLVASKAARIVEVAKGRALVDFGARRGHGPHSGFLNARASYIAGFAGTSHVEAARKLGIPAFGTMAHAWVQAFGDEKLAFETFARLFPKATTLLVDTYDTDNGVRLAAAIEPPIQAIRIDSGDLVAASKSARAILDGLGRQGVKILVSNDLNETKIDELLKAGAPIDAFGVGTELITSRDAPAISMVYKLVELDGVGRIKKSAGKKTYPLAKQVFRIRGEDGKFSVDRVARADESSDGEALLIPILREGRLVEPLPRLDAIRDHCKRQRESIPGSLRGLEAQPSYPLEYSDALEAEAVRLGLN
jgi:nicotinate phosphoribosyltransferase